MGILIDAKTYPFTSLGSIMMMLAPVFYQLEQAPNIPGPFPLH